MSLRLKPSPAPKRKAQSRISSEAPLGTLPTPILGVPDLIFVKTCRHDTVG